MTTDLTKHMSSHKLVIPDRYMTPRAVSTSDNGVHVLMEGVVGGREKELKTAVVKRDRITM